MAISSRLSYLLLSALGLPDIRDELVSNLNLTGSLANGKILIGNASNTATAVTPSGDLTISNAGVTALTSTAGAVASVTLTSAQVLLLNSTPITIVPAPGAGFTNLVLGIYSTLTFNTAAYATNAAGFTLRYTDGSGAVTATLPQAYLQSGASSLQYVPAAVSALTPVANAPLVLFAGTANPTTGDSPLKVRVFYRTVPNPLP